MCLMSFSNCETQLSGMWPRCISCFWGIDSQICCGLARADIENIENLGYFSKCYSKTK